MADSTPLLEQIDSSQAAHEATANALLAAGSIAMSYGRHAETCAALTWGYYGTRYGGTAVANGTNACGASTTTYMVAHLTTGAVSFATATTNWNDATTYGRCFKIVTGASTVTSYEDHRFGPLGISAAAAVAGSGDMMLAGVQTVTGAKTFGAPGAVGKLKIAGTTSGAATLDAPAVAGAIVITLPATTGTLALVGDITAAVNAVIASAPGALDTLDELAAALGDDANYAATVTTALALKAPLASPALTGTPTVPTAAPGTNTTQAASTAFVAAAVTAGVADGDKGDITVSSTGSVWTVDNDAITYAKMQNVSATDRLLGRSTVGAGDVEEIPLTAAGRALIDDADAAAQRATLGLNSLTTAPAFSATPTLSTTDSDVIYFGALTANVTAFNLSGTRPKVVVCFVQDGTGGRTVTAGTSIDFGTEITSLSGIGATAGTYSYVGFVYNPTTTKFRVVAISK